MSDSSFEILTFPNKLQMFMTNKPKTTLNEQIKTHFTSQWIYHVTNHQRNCKKKKKKTQIPKRPKTPHWLYTWTFFFFKTIIPWTFDMIYQIKHNLTMNSIFFFLRMAKSHKKKSTLISNNEKQINFFFFHNPLISIHIQFT